MHFHLAGRRLQSAMNGHSLLSTRRHKAAVEIAIGRVAGKRDAQGRPESSRHGRDVSGVDGQLGDWRSALLRSPCCFAALTLISVPLRREPLVGTIGACPTEHPLHPTIKCMLL